MTRIALITSSFLPRIGGVEEHVAHTAVQLRRQGHQVVIWAADQGDAVPQQHQGIPLRYLPCPLPARSVGAAGRFLRAAPRAWAAWRRAWRQDRPEVLHVHCFGPNGLYAAALARTTGTPLVYSNHGETFSDAHGAFEHSALLRAGLRAAARRAAAVTACSQFAADDLTRFGIDAAAAEVVFNGIDADEPADGDVPGLPARYVLGVGRLVGTKGFSNLIRAYARVASSPSIRGVDLVIGGTGPQVGALAELAEELGVTDRVHLIGRLSRPQVGAVMAAAQLLVVPSLVEAFGITVLEGWRAGTAVMVTSHGGPPEFVEDRVTGLLIDPQDVAALGERIAELLADDSRRSALGEAGAAAAQAFTWEKVAQRYDEIYRRVLASDLRA